MEKNKEFYDKAYRKGGYNNMYKKHYNQSPYINVWKKSIKLIEEINDPQIIEIGCGVGQFANLLFDNNIYNYKGIDFSDEAIRLARSTNNKYSEKFFVDNAYSSNIYNENYNTVVMFEVLEHLKDDLSVLNKIKEGTHILFSVPNFNSASHVRYFKNENNVMDRYNNIISIKDVYRFVLNSRNIIFLGHGIKN